MELIDIALGIGGVVSSTLYGAGLTQMNSEFAAARKCFLAAPIPLVLCSTWWTVMTDQPYWMRLASSGAVGAVLLIGITESLRWVRIKEASAAMPSPPVVSAVPTPAPSLTSAAAAPVGSAPPPAEPPSVATPVNNPVQKKKSADVSGDKTATPPVTVSGSDNVVSVGQQGGITAKSVTINPAVNPTLEIKSQTENGNDDGSHTVTLLTEVHSPFTPGLLSIQIAALGLKSVRIMPSGGEGMMMRNVKQGPSFYSTEIPGPRGQYVITVITESRTDIQLGAQF